METIHKKKSSKVTEPTPKNTETPKTPPKNFPTYRKKIRTQKKTQARRKSSNGKEKKRTKRWQDTEPRDSRPPTPTAILNNNEERKDFNSSSNVSSEEEEDDNRTEPRMTRARSALKQ